MSVFVFLNGRKLSQAETNPVKDMEDKLKQKWSLFKVIGIRGSEYEAKHIRFMGKLHMISAPIFWIIFVSVIWSMNSGIESMN